MLPPKIVLGKQITFSLREKRICDFCGQRTQTYSTENNPETDICTDCISLLASFIKEFSNMETKNSMISEYQEGFLAGRRQTIERMIESIDKCEKEIDAPEDKAIIIRFAFRVIRDELKSKLL